MKNACLIFSILFAVFTIGVLFYLPFLWQSGLVLTLEGIAFLLVAPAAASFALFFVWENAPE